MGLLNILKLQLDINDQIAEILRNNKDDMRFAVFDKLMVTMGIEILKLNDSIKREGILT